MTQQPQPQPTGPVRKVLAIADGPDSAATLSAARDLADRHRAAFCVLSCIEPPGDIARLSHSVGISPTELLDRMAQQRRSALRDPGRQTGLAHGDDIRVVIGKPFLEISRYVMTEGIDVVVKSAESLTGKGRLLFASTDQHLVRKCPCAVWLRLPQARSRPKVILATVDVDDWDAREPATLAALNTQVIEMALCLATAGEAVIHVLHVWDAPGEGLVWTFSSGADSRATARSYVDDVEKARTVSLERLISPFRTAAREKGGPKILSRLARGTVRAVISEQTDRLGADILVMGTVARTGIGGILIGNTAEDILNSVNCSVMTVKPDGFVSPLDLNT